MHRFGLAIVTDTQQRVSRRGRRVCLSAAWEDQSFNDGAGMARVSVAPAFMQAKMPLGAGGTLTDQGAYDIAAYFTAQPRPRFASTASDWPKGGRRADARR